ncbi:sensor histidine kinase [Nocardia paucivorans]|uniref:sensor histidine kinase n=1 Tax=Nocardia paucivorans TaxID=114259 RepID=UPI0002FB1459|nr:sensor histidine kinase [Nocardia paucivorans]
MTDASATDTSTGAEDPGAAPLRSRLSRISAVHLLDAAVVLSASVLFAVAWPTLHLTHAVPVPVQPFIAAFAALPVLLLRANPTLGWSISAGSALIFAQLLPNRPDHEIPFQVVHIVALNFLLFAVALRMSPPMIGVVWGATSLLLAAELAPVTDSPPWMWPMSLGSVVLTALLLRWVVLARRRLARQEEATELERARRAVLEEKARIARDLHDVVAHRMSLTVVQAQTAAYRIEGVTPQVRAEFESIGANAREALNEVRGLLGVLRSDGQVAERTPAPTATEVISLFTGAERAGMAITWTVDGELAAVSDAVGLALYRIAQEALSNAARHAPGAAVRARIVCDREIELVIVNDAPVTPVPASGVGGHGLPGMRARARAVGGDITAGPCADGGFEVRARVPSVHP